MPPEPYTYKLDEEVTVTYPADMYRPNGRTRRGTIVKRQRIHRSKLAMQRYTVLFEDGSADTFIPPAWIAPLAQEKLI